MKNAKFVWVPLVFSTLILGGCSSNKGVSSTCSATLQGVKTQIVLQAQKEDSGVEALSYVETVPFRDLLDYDETEADLQDEIQDAIEDYQEDYGVKKSAISYQIGDQEVTFTIHLSVAEFIGTSAPVYFDDLIDFLEDEGYYCD